MYTLKIIYFAYLNATVEYCIKFWGNSLDNKSLPTTENDN
jgi:hypothetical protein